SRETPADGRILSHLGGRGSAGVLARTVSRLAERQRLKNASGEDASGCDRDGHAPQLRAPNAVEGSLERLGDVLSNQLSNNDLRDKIQIERSIKRPKFFTERRPPARRRKCVEGALGMHSRKSAQRVCGQQSNTEKIES